jgi:hypothetical protein
MASSSFEDFCTSLCELIGVMPPALEPDAHGTTGFTVVYREATIGFVKDERAAQAGLLMVVELGAPPPDRELDVLRRLLDGNFTMLGVGSPTFARNPSMGHLWLCHTFQLAQLDVQRIFQGISAAADVVDSWKSHHFLDEPLPQARPGTGFDFTRYA